MEEGTERFLEAVDDRDFGAPSRLPGWSVAHVVAHVHYNAQALTRLARWAATGVESRMYDSPRQRAAEIETGARLPARTLRELVRSSAVELEAALASLSDENWRAEVVTAQGRTVPATEIPWLRVREVVVHTVDLDERHTFDVFPEPLVEALVSSAVRNRLTRGEGPVLALLLTGRATGDVPLPPWL
ncbi:maleylpyruvate isomerase N-terminal domain-containing protein [Actinomadura graeca]|uniref:Maleylpyruvate isomerase N-terminal domain-containing protein n=1 Tax=Actinomadura graeca TaxID=2750812 RepID=A0ABX8QX60_9ACTN|nr:maleylpyruvate isomerase N-terminal domain-containing protein [Actinomadura graeca]QXJ23436.1 maleylpyruvate isomerase N-terminal domain-containing protein [Actinomadura graeca]